MEEHSQRMGFKIHQNNQTKTGIEIGFSQMMPTFDVFLLFILGRIEVVNILTSFNITHLADKTEDTSNSKGLSQQHSDQWCIGEHHYIRKTDVTFKR